MIGDLPVFHGLAAGQAARACEVRSGRFLVGFQVGQLLW